MPDHLMSCGYWLLKWSLLIVTVSLEGARTFWLGVRTWLMLHAPGYRHCHLIGRVQGRDKKYTNALESPSGGKKAVVWCWRLYYTYNTINFNCTCKLCDCILSIQYKKTLNLFSSGHLLSYQAPENVMWLAGYILFMRPELVLWMTFMYCDGSTAGHDLLSLRGSRAGGDRQYNGLLPRLCMYCFMACSSPVVQIVVDRSLP